MPDYAGAIAAIKAQLVANWTATPIAYPNEPPPDPFPPIDQVTGNAAPWVLAEIESTGNTLETAGNPGHHLWVDHGLIYLHVFIDRDRGTDTAFTHASALREIFRTKEFYNSVPGFCVRTGIGRGGDGPRIDGGGSAQDSSGRAWFKVTATIPFEFWHVA